MQVKPFYRLFDEKCGIGLPLTLVKEVEVESCFFYVLEYEESENIMSVISYICTKGSKRNPLPAYGIVATGKHRRFFNMFQYSL